MDPPLSLEAGMQSALVITEMEAPASKKKAPLKKGRGKGVKTLSPTVSIQKDPKGKETNLLVPDQDLSKAPLSEAT